METFVDRRIRHAIEHVFFHKVKVSNSAPIDEVARLIRRLQPVTVPGGLRRIGPAGDGGYLVPDDFAGVSACISPGVSSECGFDLEMAELGMDVIMADASVSGPPVMHPKFQFLGEFLDVRPSERTTTIDDLCKYTTGDLVLQMDIEGAEHAVLMNMSDSLLRRFRIAVIEFHELDEMLSRFGFRAIAAVFDKLMTYHNVVHIHPNNAIEPVRRGTIIIPPIMEFTFYRRDRFTPAPQAAQFPHPLDATSMPTKPDITLPDCWWQHPATSEASQ